MYIHKIWRIPIRSLKISNDSTCVSIFLFRRRRCSFLSGCATKAFTFSNRPRHNSSFSDRQLAHARSRNDDLLICKLMTTIAPQPPRLRQLEPPFVRTLSYITRVVYLRTIFPSLSCSLLIHIEPLESICRASDTPSTDARSILACCTLSRQFYRKAEIRVANQM